MTGGTGRLAGQNSTGDADGIDVHAHLLVPEAEALVQDEPGLARARAVEAAAAGPASVALNLAQSDRVRTALTDAGHRLAAMDAQGVHTQLVSPVPTHHYWAGEQLARRYAEQINDGVLEHCAAAPDRLLGLGTAPLQHPELATQVLRTAMAGGLRGIEVSTHIEGAELADPLQAEFWATAAELRAVVFIHPWGCTLGPRLARSYLFNTVGNPTETTVALSHLIFSGTLDRHPGLRVVAAHGGGYLPGYLGRGDHAWHAREDARTCQDEPSSYLRRIWFDSLVYTPQGLRTLIEAAGPDRVVLGTDYPYDMGVTDPLDRLAAAGIDEETSAAIRRGNAAALLTQDGTRS